MRTVLAACGAAAVALLAPCARAAAPAPTIQVPALRVRADAVRNSAADPAPGKMLFVSVALAVPDQKGLDAFVTSLHDPNSPNYKHWITPDQFRVRFGRADGDVTAVRTWAAANGLTVEHAWPNNLFVTLKGTVAQFEQALNVRILGYNRPLAAADDAEPTCYAPDRDPSLPASLGPIVRAISGLDSVGRSTPAYQTVLRGSTAPGVPPPGPQPVFTGKPARAAGGGAVTGQSLTRKPHAAWPGPLTPQWIEHVYHNDLVQPYAAGQGMSIGVISPTNFSAGDAYTYMNTYGFNTFYNITEKPVDGGATDSNGALEACIDTELIFSQAPNANIIMYEQPNGPGLLDSWVTAVNDNVPVIDCAWGIFEDYYANVIVNGGTYEYSVHLELQQADAQGISVFCSTGDNGSVDPATSVTSVSFPASSPDVTAVGGTSLPGQDGTYGWSGENGWNNSGGGGSTYFPAPVWQWGISVSIRLMPDVSAEADPNSPGYSIDYSSTFVTAGGTSAASAIWAGNALLIDQYMAQHSGRRVGNLAADLWHFATEYGDGGGFIYHDTTTGNNGYPGQAGYDNVTGLGSADFYKLFADECLSCDLVPFTPVAFAPGNNAWTGPVIVHASSTDSTEPQFYDAGNSYYVGMSAINNGPADAPINSLAMDPYGSAYALVSMGPYTSANGPFSIYPWDYYATLNGGGYYTLSTPGYYQFGEQIDYYNVVPESNKNNNWWGKIVPVASNAAQAPALSSIQVSPGSVVGGNNVTGRVTLAANAPTGGAWVPIVSGNTAAASVPFVVQVPAGTNTATFTISTYGVSATTIVSLFARCGGATQATSLSVAKAIVNTVVLSTSPTAGGVNVTGTVNLTGQAPPGGLVVTLNSTVPAAATVPASITVPAGQASAQFTVTTYPQNTDTFTTIQATAYGSTRSAGLTVQYPRILSITYSANPVAGGQSTICTITQTGPSPAAGMPYSLASSNFPIAQVPITATVLPGATTGGFLITTHDPAATTTVTISLKTHGVTTPSSLTVNH